MANPPPPYADITGISRTVMKDNAQETLVNYNGNARPGEIVADLTTDPPTMYVGNNAGELTLLSAAGSYGNVQVAAFLSAGLVGNIVPAGNGTHSLGNSSNWWSNVWVAGNTLYLGGVPLGMSGNTLTVNGAPISGGNASLPLANGTSNFNIAVQDGAATITADATNVWTFDSNGQFTAPGDIRTGNVGTDGRFVQDCGDGTTSMRWVNIDINDNAQLIRAYSGDPADGNDIERGQIAMDWTDANVSGITIESFDQTPGAEASYQWQFLGSGNLVLPSNGSVIFDGGDGHIGPDGDDLLISWDNEELVLRSVQGDVELQADSDVILRARSDGAGDYLTKWIATQNNEFTNITGDANVIAELGNLNIQGGRDTLANGNVIITAVNTGVAINTWTFGNDGNLTLTQGSKIREVASPVPGNYALALTGTGVADPDQQLLIYPTFVDANHLHLTSGNLYNTELFLGNDDLYVKLANTGNILINSNDSIGNTAQWTFDTTGTLTAPGNISAGNIGLSERITCQNVVTDPVNLGSLTAVFGARAFILDGNLAAAGNFGVQVSGGGGNSVPVWSDGVNWYIG